VKNLKLQKETLGMLLGLVGVIMFAMTLPMTRIAVKEINPVWLALARAELAAILGAAALIWFKVPFPKRVFWPNIAWSIVGVVIGFPLFTSIAMRFTDASHGAVITGLLPLATAAFAMLTSKDRPSLAFWLSALAGSCLVLGYALWQSQGAIQIGDLAMLAAIIFAGLGYAFGGRLSQTIGGWQAISWVLVCAAPLVALPLIYMAYNAGSLLGSAQIGPTAISTTSWWAFAYVTIFSQFVGFIFWYGGMAIGGVARVSQVQLLQLFFTLGFAGLINDEIVRPITWLVCFLVAITILINKKTAIRKA
jgi:drug/metabolite transporter (DMT)-like permease